LTYCLQFIASICHSNVIVAHSHVVVIDGRSQRYSQGKHCRTFFTKFTFLTFLISLCAVHSFRSKWNDRVLHTHEGTAYTKVLHTYEGTAYTKVLHTYEGTAHIRGYCIHTRVLHTRGTHVADDVGRNWVCFLFFCYK